MAAVQAVLSLDERERRYKAIREQMADRDLDVLIVVGRDGPATRGDFRYIAGYGPVTPLPSYAVFPRTDIEPVFMARTGNRSRVAIESGWVRDRKQSWVGLDELLLAEIDGFKGSGAVGVVRPANIPVQVYLALVERYGDAVVDAGDIFTEVRLVKSGEEIECARAAGRAADAAHEFLKDWIAPGRNDREFYGEARRIMHTHGSEYSMDLVGVDVPDVYAPVGDVFGADSYVVGELTPAVVGVYNQLPFEFTLGAARAERADLNDVMREAHAAMADALRPGLTVAELYEIGREAIERRNGFVAGKGQFGHDLGYDVVDGFSVLADNDLVLQAGNMLVLHPIGSQGSGPRMLLGQSFVVTEDGSEPLNAVDPFDA